MKLGATALIIVLTITSINHAVASGWHNHHYKNNHRGRGHHYNSHHRKHGYQYKTHHLGHGHHYKNHHRRYRYYSYAPRRYYSHYDNHGYYALGGLIVGGILGATLTNSYNNRAQHSNYSRTVYVPPKHESNSVQPSYVIQPDGVCYVVNHVNNGKLILSPVSPGNCQ